MIVVKAWGPREELRATDSSPLEEIVRGYRESWMEIAKAAGEGRAPSERKKKFMNAKNFTDIRPVV